MIIGLTGGIASGKTTVSNQLKELGAEIIDADEIAFNILQKGEQAWQKVIDCFGEKILKDDQEINRSLLGKIIFNQPQARKKLEAITHPVIIAEIKRKIKSLKDKQKIIVLVAPLLYESNLDNLVDAVWVVFVEKKTQLKRLRQRDNLSVPEAKKRIEAQIPLIKKKEMADVVIVNEGTKQDLKIKVIKLWGNVNEEISLNSS